MVWIRGKDERWPYVGYYGNRCEVEVGKKSTTVEEIDSTCLARLKTNVCEKSEEKDWVQRQLEVFS